MAVVRILGVDPGTLVAGFGCLEVAEAGAPAARGPRPLALRADNAVQAPGQGSLRVLAAGVWRLGSDRTPLEHRLLQLARDLAQLLEQLRPDELALEEAFFGKSVQSALRIGEARGVVLAQSARAGLAVHQFAPARIKRAIAGQGNARKETVAAMVHRLLGPGQGVPGELPADATDALAVALARADQRRSPLASRGLARGARRRAGGWPLPATGPLSDDGDPGSSARDWSERPGEA